MSGEAQKCAASRSSCVDTVESFCCRVLGVKTGEMGGS